MQIWTPGFERAQVMQVNWVLGEGDTPPPTIPGSTPLPPRDWVALIGHLFENLTQL